MKNWFVVLLLLINISAFSQQEDFETVDFTRSDSIAKAHHGASLKNLPKLSYDLTHQLPTDVEKFRAIFKWVAENITNDYDLFTRNQSKRAKLEDEVELKAWNEKMRAQMFKHLIDRKSTVCTGYAYLVKELSAFAGIEAEIVDGYGRTIRSNVGAEAIVNHSWNAVKLNDKWYLCDPTWASGAIDITSRKFIPNYQDVYFLSAPAFFIRNHYPVDSKWMLTPSVVDLQTFLNRPIIYAAAYKHKILPHEPNTFDVVVRDNLLRLTFQIDSANTADQLRLKINSILSKPVTLERSEPGLVTIEYNLKRKGRYVVHALVSDEVICTYRVEVE